MMASISRRMADDVKAIEKEMHAVEMRIAQLAFERKRAEESIAANVEQRARLAAEIDTLQAEIAAALPELEAVRAGDGPVWRAAARPQRGNWPCSKRKRAAGRVPSRMSASTSSRCATRSSRPTATCSGQGWPLPASTSRWRNTRVMPNRPALSIQQVETGVAENRHDLERLQGDLIVLETRRDRC